MMTQLMARHRRRSPPGVARERPIQVRFMPAEREEINDLAAQDARTLSSFVRTVFLLGLPEWKRRQDLP